MFLFLLFFFCHQPLAHLLRAAVDCAALAFGIAVVFLRFVRSFSFVSRLLNRTLRRREIANETKETGTETAAAKEIEKEVQDKRARAWSSRGEGRGRKGRNHNKKV